ncbi:XPA-binding protein, putative [Eimeria brunetti]|uniref:XPA-binding protein, putative n=1 Tax=Eimeria brunetti TaxID=51314 RepID=U6M092_9EIME|nr:XPA-binding protein, putative [Eimeria brunetti]
MAVPGSSKRKRGSEDAAPSPASAEKENGVEASSPEPAAAAEAAAAAAGAAAADGEVDLDELVGGDEDIAYEQELRRDPYQVKVCNLRKGGKGPPRELQIMAFVFVGAVGAGGIRTFDAALRALAVTQHDQLWPMMIEYVKNCGVVETAVCLYRRWVMLEPERRDEFAAYLAGVGRKEEAASWLAAAASDGSVSASSGRSRHELWLSVCELAAAAATAATPTTATTTAAATGTGRGASPLTSSPPVSRIFGSIQVEALLRSGIRRFSDSVAGLWCSLARLFLQQGLPGKARVIFEEALGKVQTIRDLAVVYEAYAAFEEATIAQLLQQQQQHLQHQQQQQQQQLQQQQGK